MTSIAEYIGGGIRGGRPIAPSRIIWSRPAAHLCRLYLKCKSVNERYERVKIPDNPRYRTVFETLHHRIVAYEQESGIRVDRNRYLRAHFAFFGTTLYPSKLLTTFSWALYKTHERLESTQEEQGVDEEVLQGKLLRFLSLTRGESELRVLKQLKDSGLFTPEFVGSRGLTCQWSITRSIDPGSGNSSPS